MEAENTPLSRYDILLLLEMGNGNMPPSSNVSLARLITFRLVKKAGKGFQLTTAGLDRIQRITRAGNSR